VANLILPRRFQRQPTGLLEISAEARANGLHAALLPAAQGWQDIAGKLAVTGGGGTRSTSGGSLGNTRKLTSGADFLLDPTAGAPVNYMWVLHGSLSGLATWAGIFSRTSDNGTAQGWAWQRYSSNDTLRVYNTNGATSGADFTNLGTVNDLLDNRPHTFVGLQFASNLALYRDGVLIRSGTISSSPTYVPGQGQVKIGSSRDTIGLTAELSLAALFYPRGDPNAYAQALSRNPWQIFKPPRRVLYFNVGGGGVHDAASALSGAAIGAFAVGSQAIAAASSASALSGAGASLTGSAARTCVHYAASALSGAGASLTGSAALGGAHNTTSALSGAGASLTGSAALTHVHSAASVLYGAGASLTGSAALGGAHNTTSALSGVGATLSGVAWRGLPSRLVRSTVTASLAQSLRSAPEARTTRYATLKRSSP
jgi:hypothetical protein